MVNSNNEIAEKMPWIKKKDNPQKPWDNSGQDGAVKATSRMVANRDDVINKIKSIQAKLNVLTDEKDALAVEKDALTGDLEKAREEINEKNGIIEEKENGIKDLNDQVELMEVEKQTWNDKLSDLQKALKTATSEKAYLEQELAAADKAISEINNLLSS